MDPRLGLVAGDEEADPEKYRRLLEEGVGPTPIAERRRVRLEAENSQVLEGCELEDRNDRDASHRLNVVLTEGRSSGRMSTRFDEPYTAATARYDVDVRYLDEQGTTCRLALFVNGEARGGVFVSPGTEQGWATYTVRGVEVGTGDENAVEINGSGRVRVDYVQLNRQADGAH